MQSQKKIKPLPYQLKQFSQKKDKKQKPDKIITRAHKASQVHTKSVSKDITPKKQSIIVRKSKYKDTCSSNKKINKNRNKQLTSMCSYSMIEKQSMPVTKRKGSNAYSIKKNGMIRKSRDKMSSSIKSAVNNFSILTKCLTQYLKQQKKTGKNPSKQILHLIKAFNRSQIAPLSKDLQKLISKMLDYIQNNITFYQNHDLLIPNSHHPPKSRSSFSQTSQHQITYSQILDHNFVPSTLKKQTKHQNKSSTYDNINDQKNKTNIDIKHSPLHQQQKYINIIPQKYIQKSIIDKQLQKQLKNDIKSMHHQLCHLKSTGQKLQQISGTKYHDRKKLQQLYHQNQSKIAQFNKFTTENLKYGSFKTQQDQEQGHSSQSQGNVSQSGKE